MSATADARSDRATVEPWPTVHRFATALGEFPPHLFPSRLLRTCALIEEYGGRWRAELANRLGLSTALARPQTVEDLVRQRGWAPDFRSPLSWLLDALAADGAIAVDRDAEASRYVLQAAVPDASLGPIRREAVATDPRSVATLDLLDCAGAAYPRIARAEISGEQALLAPDRLPLWFAYFSNDNPGYVINNELAAVAAANRMPDVAPLTVLEVGAGTGSATERLLDRLLERALVPIRYIVTDPNPAFLARAQRRLVARYPDVRLEFAPLDMNAPWQSQTDAWGRIDLVFAVNVFHVARDLDATVSAARAALASGGWLVVGECMPQWSRQPIAAELAFCLFSSFGAGMRRQRPGSGFLTAAEWEAVLHRGRFHPSEVVPNHGVLQSIAPGFIAGVACGQRA